MTNYFSGKSIEELVELLEYYLKSGFSADTYKANIVKKEIVERFETLNNVD